MSTPERPLTRRQLKELRMTGQLPVVVPGATPVQQGQPATADDKPAAAAPKRDEERRPTPAPEPEAVETATPYEPAQDAPAQGESTSQEQSGGRPLTRRQARTLRTNSVPVTDGEASAAVETAPEPPAVELPAGFADAVPTQAAPPSEDRLTDRLAPAPAKPAAPVQPAPVRPESEAAEPARSVPEPAQPAPADAGAKDDGPKVGAAFGAAVFQQAEERQRLEREAAEREALHRRETKATATTGAEDAAAIDADEVFAEAFQRSLDAGGSTATGTSLILHDMPGTASLSAPVTATGELLITSSHVLPTGLASRGAAAGTTDGKDVDATLLDGEIPLHSSPTPISASAAVSTSKAPGDVIRPPAREKNHGLMLTLGITAGGLGAALVGVIIYAFATGVFG
ncbi:hypothetical protein [Microbacterium sp. Marseille-Q6965]|uniref:hypothetical protein n=1 Tax=Microbacterium sp. Marseille-Q6965 TaxID=2965072 RepID=UPI0021B73FA4|nr:hypothetical protein [Microbacterium sp. Marseille-Q6965]